MKKFCSLFIVLVICTLSGYAQRNYPKNEIFLGYSFGSIEVGQSTSGDSTNGWAVSMTRNWTSFFGITTDYGADFGSAKDALFALAPLQNFNQQQLLIGPKITVRGDRWEVFVRAMAGFSRQKLTGLILDSTDCTVLGIDCSTIPGSIPLPDGSFSFSGRSVTKLAMSYGVGVDYKLFRLLAVRLAQVDYMPVRAAEGPRDWRQNIRLQSGLVFRF